MDYFYDAASSFFFIIILVFYFIIYLAGCIKLPFIRYSVPSDVIHNTVRRRLVRITAGLRLERLTRVSTPVKEPLYMGGFATAATLSQCCVAHRARMSPAYPSWLTAFLGINQTTL